MGQLLPQSTAQKVKSDSLESTFTHLFHSSSSLARLSAPAFLLISLFLLFVDLCTYMLGTLMLSRIGEDGGARQRGSTRPVSRCSLVRPLCAGLPADANQLGWLGSVAVFRRVDGLLGRAQVNISLTSTSAATLAGGLGCAWLQMAPRRACRSAWARVASIAAATERNQHYSG